MSPSMQTRLFARSLLLQACWSFERMQALGLAYCLEPWLRRVWSDPDALREARARHQAFFNTQPYVAGLVIGMICGLEEEAAAAPPEERAARLERLEALKSASSTALAGIGDAFFWGALRPFCAALAAALGLALLPHSLPGAVAWAAGAYLLVHNGAALTLRWRGLRLGYEWRGEIALRLQELPAQAAIRRVRWAGFALALASAGALAAALPSALVRRGALAAAAFLLLKRLSARVGAHGFYAAACVFGAAVFAAARWTS